jgi:hypothetical protein
MSSDNGPSTLQVAASQIEKSRSYPPVVGHAYDGDQDLEVTVGASRDLRFGPKSSLPRVTEQTT